MNYRSEPLQPDESYSHWISGVVLMQRQSSGDFHEGHLTFAMSQTPATIPSATAAIGSVRRAERIMQKIDSENDAEYAAVPE